MLHRLHAEVPVSRFFGIVDGLLLSEPVPDSWAERANTALRAAVTANSDLEWGELVCRQGICRLSVTVKPAGPERMAAFISFGDEVRRLMKELPATSIGNGMETGGFYYYLFNTDPAAPYVEVLYEQLLPELEPVEHRRRSP